MKRTVALLPLIPFLFFLSLFWQLLSASGNIIGHDHLAMMPRLLLGAAHFWQNGLALPHFTPSIYGGLPFLADPQSTYFSLPQILSFWIDPWIAVRLATVFFLIIGYWGMFRVAKVYEWSNGLAHFAGLLFIANGFIFARAYVGHLTFHAWPLISWALYCVIADKFWLKRACLLGLIHAYFIFSGSAHVFTLSLLTLAILFPVVFFQAKDWRTRLTTTTALCLGLGLALLASLGKLTATFLYAKYFHQYPVDSSHHGLLTTVFRYFWFIPALAAENIQFGSWSIGAWEYTGFISKFTLPLVLIMLAKSNRKIIAYCVVIVGALALIAQGTELNALLPIFSHYHLPIRLLSVLIPFITLIAVAGLAQLRISKNPFVVTALSALVVAEFFFQAGFFTNKKLGLGYEYRPQIYSELKKLGRLPRVQNVISDRGDGSVLIVNGMTSMKAYEPLFGYKGEKYQATLSPGATNTINQGRFNMTHPGCFLAPKFYQCKPWDRIDEKDRVSFERFVEGRADAFTIPSWQLSLYQLGFLIIALMLTPWVMDLAKFKMPSLKVFPMPFRKPAP